MISKIEFEKRIDEKVKEIREIIEDEGEELKHEIVDSEVDIYTQDLKIYMYYRYFEFQNFLNDGEHDNIVNLNTLLMSMQYTELMSKA